MKLKKGKLYSEACQSMRHYSNLIIQIRSTIFVQGFVVITAAGVMITEGRYLMSAGISIFGLILTIILQMLSSNYGKHHQTFLEYAVNLENEGFDGPSPAGPWSAYFRPRDVRFSRRVYRMVIFYGPSILLGITMIVVAAYSIVMMISKP